MPLSWQSPVVKHVCRRITLLMWSTGGQFFDPFLSGEDGVLSKNRSLESLSSGVHMAQGELKSID